MDTLNALAKRAYTTAVDKGHWSHHYLGTIPGPVYHVPSADPMDGPRDIYNPSIFEEKLMLIVTEVAEATEARRDHDEEQEALEVADIIIRALDYSAARGFDIDAAVEAKMAKNEKRPYKHGRPR